MSLSATIQSLQTETTKTAEDLAQVRRLIHSRNTLHSQRSPGLVTDDCASHPWTCERLVLISVRVFSVSAVVASVFIFDF